MVRLSNGMRRRPTGAPKARNPAARKPTHRARRRDSPSPSATPTTRPPACPALASIGRLQPTTSQTASQKRQPSPRNWRQTLAHIRITEAPCDHESARETKDSRGRGRPRSVPSAHHIEAKQAPDAAEHKDHQKARGTPGTLRPRPHDPQRPTVSVPGGATSRERNQRWRRATTRPSIQTRAQTSPPVRRKGDWRVQGPQRTKPHPGPAQLEHGRARRSTGTSPRTRRSTPLSRAIEASAQQSRPRPMRVEPSASGLVPVNPAKKTQKVARSRAVNKLRWLASAAGRLLCSTRSGPKGPRSPQTGQSDSQTEPSRPRADAEPRFFTAWCARSSEVRRSVARQNLLLVDGDARSRRVLEVKPAQGGILRHDGRGRRPGPSSTSDQLRARPHHFGHPPAGQGRIRLLYDGQTQPALVVHPLRVPDQRKGDRRQGSGPRARCRGTYLVKPIYIKRR